MDHALRGLDGQRDISTWSTGILVPIVLPNMEGEVMRTTRQGLGTPRKVPGFPVDPARTV